MRKTFAALSACALMALQIVSCAPKFNDSASEFGALFHKDDKVKMNFNGENITDIIDNCRAESADAQRKETISSFKKKDGSYIVVHTVWGEDFSIAWYDFDKESGKYSKIDDPFVNLEPCKEAIERGLSLQYQVYPQSGININVTGYDKSTGIGYDNLLTTAAWDGEKFTILDEEYDFEDDGSYE